MYIVYNNKKYILTEKPHFEYHDGLGCMSCVNSDEWVMASARDEKGAAFELWWKCPKSAAADSVLEREPDDVLDENGKYVI